MENDELSTLIRTIAEERMPPEITEEQLNGLFRELRKRHNNSGKLENHAQEIILSACYRDSRFLHRLFIIHEELESLERRGLP